MKVNMTINFSSPKGHTTHLPCRGHGTWTVLTVTLGVAHQPSNGVVGITNYLILQNGKKLRCIQEQQ